MLDPIKSTFGICDENSDGKLLLNEIHQDHCLETLEKIFGLTQNGLHKLFPQIDANADMKISLEEASIAFERTDTIYYDISPELAHWEVVDAYDNLYKSYNSEVNGMSEEMQFRILLIAEEIRKKGGTTFTMAYQMRKNLNKEIHECKRKWMCAWFPYRKDCELSLGQVWKSGRLIRLVHTGSGSKDFDVQCWMDPDKEDHRLGRKRSLEEVSTTFDIWLKELFTPPVGWRVRKIYDNFNPYAEIDEMKKEAINIVEKIRKEGSYNHERAWKTRLALDTKLRERNKRWQCAWFPYPQFRGTSCDVCCALAYGTVGKAINLAFEREFEVYCWMK